MSLKHLFLAVSVLGLGLLVVSCGSTTGATGAGSTPAATTSSVQVLVHTATAKVGGKSETILTNARGLTLYYFTADTATKVACSGTCAGVWHPLLATGSGTVTSATPLSGKLSVVTTANGKQVEYNGHPLYTYSKDTAPGQTNGEGFKGKWFVAMPNLSAPSGSNNGY